MGAPNARPVDPALDQTLRDDSERFASPRPELVATTAMFLESSQLARASTAKSELAPFAPGYLLANRYRIRERIGHGGFGFVYSAEDLELEVIVAIKVLRPDIDRNQEMVRRFKQEIQLARQVTHQNVCRIFDVGFYQLANLRVPFLSMELLEGESLADRMRGQGLLPIGQVKLLTLQVASALEAAHRAGIVHADLKPANIMLVGQGLDTRAVVTDFGLASAHTAEAVELKGGIVGTPAYMAPEQVQGDALTPAADFYALGCTIYHLLSGALPFEEDTALSTAKARLNRAPPSLRTAAPEAPTLWVSLVRDLMAVDPNARLADTPALRRRLRGSRMAWIVGSSLLLVFLLAGTLYLTKERAYGEFSLQRPPAGPALERYEQGLAQLEAFNTEEAAAIWQKAIDDGFAHARIYHDLCDALFVLQRSQRCRENAFRSARKGDERDYYEALYRSEDRASVEATKLVLRLLRRYPGNLEVSLILVRIQRQQQEFDKALETLARIRPKDARERVTMEASRVSILTQQKSYREAIAVGTAALRSAHELGMVREELSILESLGQSHRNLSELIASEAYGEQSLRLARSVHSPRDEATAISLLVANAMAQEHYARAEELVEMRTQYLRDIESIAAADRMLITKSEIWLVAGKPREAEALLSEQALPLLRSAKDVYWEGYALVARSEMRRSLGKSSQALDDCYAADAIFRGIRHERLQAYSKMVCGYALIDAGRLSEAEEQLAEARNLRTQLKLGVLLLENTIAEAELSLARGETKAAYDGALEATARYTELGRTAKVRSGHELMGRVALADGDLERASRALQAARALGGSENIEAGLRLQLLELRTARLRSPDEATEGALEVFAQEADATGYARIANEARVALAHSMAGTDASGAPLGRPGKLP